MTLGRPGVAGACNQPAIWRVTASFDLAGSRLLPASDPQIAASSPIHSIPASLLKAVGWVESGWRQYAAADKPLLSPDFGYGIMQITSGMAGAFGDARGSLPANSQSRIASDFQYNIGYGARMLAEKWATVPRIGTGDPSVVEDWYYALWAYNGWGWVNNPNNPRFSRTGTPATDPAAFPYQERVLYLVAHPPKDAAGNPLWKPIAVTMPSRSKIGSQPGPLAAPAHPHRQPPPRIAADYSAASLSALTPGGTEHASVRVVNTGTVTWTPAGTTTAKLSYHVFSQMGNPWQPFTPVSPGVVAFGQSPVALSQTVRPGQSAVVSATIHAPSSPGMYRIAWDLEQPGGSYLSQSGILPFAQQLRVLQPGSTIASPTPTATAIPDKQEDLKYLADTAAPDGTKLLPGQSFTKGWLVFNGGRSAWGKGWSLHLVAGPSFGAKTMPVPPTGSCRSANIVVTLRAPTHSGTTTGVWQLVDPQGHRVGQRVTVVVVIRSPPRTPTPTPHPVSTPPSHAKATSTPTATPVG
jgi:Ig-like domain from next to BRCA1 gene/Transglycosylase SLT domain